MVGEFILNYTNPTSVYLYFVTLIVDIHDARRKEYARKLIEDIPLELKRLKDKGMDIKEIGAFAVSPEGKRNCPIDLKLINSAQNWICLFRRKSSA